jgi:hypothetical protein
MALSWKNITITRTNSGGTSLAWLVFSVMTI